MPLTVLEGMACGLPVVASTVGGNPEIVSDGVTGFLVPPGDVHALATRLNDLLADSALRQRMGSEARRIVVESHSWDRAADQSLAVYERALAR
jgi:glycosyltransferase involved in cell wall biosynthesis